MKVLLVEDHTYIATSLRDDLAERYDWEVVLAKDPGSAQSLLEEQAFDVAVVDLQFASPVEDLGALARPARWADLRWVRSGLSVVACAQRSAGPDGRPPGVALYTAADAVRRLHLIYAHDELDVRAFCSKRDGLDEIVATIRAAADGAPYVVPDLRARMPMASAAMRIGPTLLGTAKRRNIWAALASGITSSREIGRFIPWSDGAINNELTAMADGLATFDPNQYRRGKRQALLVAYAESNRSFFLDETVQGRDAG